MKTLKILFILCLLAVFSRAADVELDFDFEEDSGDLEAPMPGINKNLASNFKEPEISTNYTLRHRLLPSNVHDNLESICAGNYESCKFCKYIYLHVFIYLTLTNIYF
jgi:hypothetical protein